MKFLKKYKIIIAIVFVGLCLCCVPFVWNNWFFGEKTTIADTLKYVGAFIGGTLIAVNAYFIYKRAKELNRSNNLVAKGQLDTRFKDAATLLAAENTSAKLSGIYALHQIAIEAWKMEDQKDYVRVIKDILIAFIKENPVIEYKKDEKNSAGIAYNTKSNIVLRTIIDKLFKSSECEIYAEYPTDLSGTVLTKMDFFVAQLQGVKFSQADLQGADFFGAYLHGADFFGANLQCASFEYAYLQGADFREANLQNAYFNKADLQGASFGSACDIDKADFRNAYWNEKTDFEGTAFENKTIEELTEIMGNPPTPLDK
jgi:Uncharacterized low-complexity proteins